MPRSKQVFRTSSPMHRAATWADAVVMVGLGVLLYAGVRLALGAPAAIRGPEISLAPSVASLVLANVPQNAVKFSPPGGKVRVLARAEGAEAILAVSDSGPGVTPDERDRLFERFYRGSGFRSAETPGSGLGLAISRSLVEAQGGRITVETMEGGGATFRIHLPLAC